MKHITLAALLLAAMLPAQAAVYACKDASGRTTYTQDPRGKNCQTSDLGRPSVYSSVKPSSDSTTYTPRQTAYEGSSPSGGQTVAGGINNEQIAAAQQRLQTPNRPWKKAGKCATATNATTPNIWSGFPVWKTRSNRLRQN